MPGFGSVLSACFEALLIIIRTALRPLVRVFKSPPPPDFRSDVVLITGAAQGLGKALAFKFAEYGASVLVLWDIQEAKLRAVREELSASGHNVFAYAVDCSKRAEIQRAAERVKEEVGNVSVLVNNAGVMPAKPLLEMEDAEIERTFDVNILAYVWAVRAFLPAMVEMNRGHVVFISSVSSFTGGPNISDYAASKAAVQAFARSLHAELLVAGKTGVGVSCISPWHINTALSSRMNTRTLLHRAMPVMEPGYVAGRVIRAVADKDLLVVIPWSYNIVAAMTLFLPSQATDALFIATIGRENIRRIFENRPT